MDEDGNPSARAEDDSPETEVYRYGDFLKRLDDQGGLDVREMIDGNVDGAVYHHRGVRVPGYNVTFVREEAGSRDVPAFSVEVDTVGPRRSWAVFDATRRWDVFLVQSDGGFVIAWMCDEEFAAEDAQWYDSKSGAVADGSFSFGIFVHAGQAWTQRAQLLETHDTPAIIPHEDDQFAIPDTEEEFYEYLDISPGEFRARNSAQAPDHLGLLEFELSIDL